MKCDVGNPGARLEQAYKCGGVKQVKRIPTLIMYYTNTAMNALSL
jgi:hypothetical protein